MPQNHKLCIVVADGGHARFLLPASDNALHTFHEIKSSTVHKHDRDLVSDREGRSLERVTSAHHAFAPRHDPARNGEGPVRPRGRETDQ